MPKPQPLAEDFLEISRIKMLDKHLPTIVDCLRRLSDKEIWWRPNRASNSVGNLVLHLSGNIRQWIVAGLGGAPDWRQRDREFAEAGPLPRRALITLLTQTVTAAAAVLEGLTPADLERRYLIQGHDVTGMQAVYDVVAHFSHHAGQIIWTTKQRRARDLGFTRLPKVAAAPLPAPLNGKRPRLAPDGPMWPWLDAQRPQSKRRRPASPRRAAR